MKIKKLFFVMIFMICLTASLTIVSLAADPPSYPESPDPAYDEFVVAKNNSNNNYYYIVMDDSDGYLDTNNTALHFPANGAYILWHYAENYWNPGFTTFTTECGFSEGAGWTIIDASYAIGSFAPKEAHFTVPEDNSTYTDYNPHIEWEYTGFMSNELRVQVDYTGQDGVTATNTVSNEFIDYITTPGTGIINSSFGIPWGTGVNVVRLQALIAGFWVNQDTLTLNMTYEQPSVLSLVGINEGASYEVPPKITLTKKNYPDAVGLYVNGEKYGEYRAATETYPIFDFWTDNVKIGANVLKLVNMRTNEEETVINFTVTKGFIDSSGNYDNEAWHNTDGEGDTSGGIDKDSWQNLKDQMPEKPGEGAGIIEWVIYIAEYIGWLFSLAVGAIIEFAKTVAGLLSSLFDMISPVFVFLQVMFSALPGPLSVGLYALFVLGVVFALIKVIRRG